MKNLRLMLYCKVVVFVCGKMLKDVNNGKLFDLVDRRKLAVFLANNAGIRDVIQSLFDSGISKRQTKKLATEYNKLIKIAFDSLFEEHFPDILINKEEGV